MNSAFDEISPLYQELPIFDLLQAIVPIFVLQVYLILNGLMIVNKSVYDSSISDTDMH